MEKGVERISVVLPPKAAKKIWRIFSAVTPRGGVGWGDPLPSGSQQKALTVLQKHYVGTPWGRTTPDGKGSKNNVTLDNTQVKIVHRRGKNSKITTKHKQRDPVLLLKTKQKQHLF